MDDSGLGGGLSPDQVVWAYRLLLGREPENEDVIMAHLRMPSRAHMIRSMINSEEFRRSDNRGEQYQFPLDDLRAYAGYCAADLEVFSKFDTRSVQAKPGFVTDWIGSRTRITSLWRGCESLENTVVDLPVPADYHAETIEWLGTLKAVLAATSSFSVMELGAGHGPWLAASCAAARNLGLTDIHVSGVEADPGRFRMLIQNIADNQLAYHVVSLLQAAVGVEAGKAQWPRIPDPANNSGMRPVRENNEEDAAYVADRADEMVDVEIVPLGQLLVQRPLWDLLHIDIQGTEAELCAACLNDLTERVRYLVIGTHTREIDAQLIKTLYGAGWLLEHEKPTRMVFDPTRSLALMTTGDGAQVWRNPRL